jgi:dihydrodipicolinate synthase/N-acetylneuraminate lyase
MPILVYNSPKATGVDIVADFAAELAEIEWVVGIKQSTLDFTVFQETVAACGSRIRVFTGHSAKRGLASVIAGAVGFVSSLDPHVLGREGISLFELSASGDYEAARKVQMRTLMLDRGLGGITSGPAVMKAAMNMLNRPGGYPRRPLLPASDAENEKIRKVLDGLGLFNQPGAPRRLRGEGDERRQGGLAGQLRGGGDPLSPGTAPSTRPVQGEHRPAPERSAPRIVVSGCTGESWAPDSEERLRLFRHAREPRDRDVPSSAAPSGVVTGKGRLAVEAAIEAGCDGVLVMPPYYAVIGEREIKAHFKAISDEVRAPIFSTTCPSAPASNMPPRLIAELPSSNGSQRSSRARTTQRPRSHARRLR